ncbi:MAG: dipeptide epimerase [Haloplanus sp.]
MSEISSVSVRPVDIPLDSPFEIALGTQTAAENLFVRVETEAGAVGIGEAAPHSAVTGATRDAALAQARDAAAVVRGRESGNYRAVVDDLRDTFPGMVSANVALEAAVLDAHCRERGVPLSELFGGQPTPLETDVTVSMVSPEKARASAARAADDGYGTVKVKTGDAVEESVARVEAVAEAHPDCEITVDANQGWSPAAAIRFCREMADRGVDLALVEQPVPADDVGGLAEVKRRVEPPVAADEAVFTPADALRVVEREAADVINVKLAKSGLIDGHRIASVARAGDVDLMIGCMLESAVGLHAAAHLVAGIGGVFHVDLDGNVSHSEHLGGEEPSPTLDPSGPGHGVRPAIEWDTQG